MARSGRPPRAHLSRAAALTLALLVGGVLSGCTGAPVGDPHASGSTAPADEAEPVAEVEPETEPEVVEIPAGTIVGTARFESELHDVSGTVDVVATPGAPLGDVEFNWSLVFHDVVLPQALSDTTQFRLVARPNGGGSPCMGTWPGEGITPWSFEGGEGTALFGNPFPESDPYFTDSDPSWNDSLIVLGPATENPDESGCFYPIALHADFEWSMPTVRPWLQVVDGEPRSGATGATILVDDTPVSYAVAPNDTLDAVADRLGITADDLLYLNPARQNATSTGPEILVAGEQLNLVVSDR
jgi:hypothetical protein